MRMDRKSRRTRMSSGGGTTLWLSFSDLMSALLLIFVLIMFYIMYQYFDMYEVNMAEIARQQYDLDQANADLTEKTEKLTAAEAQMVAQQIRLNAAQKDLDDAESVLAQQQKDLALAQSLLDEKEQEIASQKTALDTLSAQLSAQQIQLDQQQKTVDEQQVKLDEQQKTVDAQQIKLDQQQLTMNAQQTKLDEQQQTLEQQQIQIEQLVGLKTRIITSLSDALRAAHISAQVDPSNGSIALQSEVLFALNRYDLTDNGKRFVDQFLKVYLDVLFSDEYREYVSEIIIEGHTDSTGGYIRNLALSQQRAYAVASYVLDDAYTGITADQKRLLREVVTANGRSYSDPVLDAFGREDEAASRRVVFKFRLTDEQMIQQLKSILEQQDIPEQEPEE